MGLLTIVRGQEVVVYGSRYTFDSGRSSERTESPAPDGRSTKREPSQAETRQLESQDRAQPREDAGPDACQADVFERLELRDPITKAIGTFLVCWSLSTAGEPPEHLEMSAKTKVAIEKEAILLAKQEMERDKWKVFER